MKKIYRFSAFFISVVLMLTFVCVTAFAYPAVSENGITYSSANLKDVNGNFGEYYKVEYCMPTVSGKVEIKPEINGVPVVLISKEVFKGKEKITQVVIPESVARIEDSAFENCAALNKVTINSEKCQIGKRAFKNCPDLEEINIPNQITSISQETFNGCSKLKNAAIPQSVTVIGPDAFSLCSSLTSVTIPKNVYSIGENAFANCSGIEEFAVDALNTDYKAINGMLYSADGKTLIQYPNGKKEEEITIPAGTETIGDFAAGANTVVKKVIIPGGVKTISTYAFCDCPALSDAVISGGVTSIGSMAFARCPSLKEISLPASLKSFEGAFYQSGVEKVTLNDGITLIDSKTFEGCEKLSEIIIPSSVRSIGMGAFDGCISLKNIVIPKEVTSIGENAFLGCTSIKPTVEIGSAAHKYCIDNGVDCTVTGSREIISISVKSMPKKTSYYYKQNLETDGLVLSVKYNDFTSEEVKSGYTAAPAYFDSVGTKNISVSFAGAETSFKVSVSYAWWQQIIRILLLGIFWY
ncbi:MAG: leucine-rich repeat protein [Clostridia bacterium]|nr:leucine-rich repeat protein [Clostridia bacterium]